MSRRTFTDDEKAHALALFVEHGATEAARQTGIAKGTIAAWASRNGIASVATENLKAAIEVHQLSAAERRARVQERLWRIADEASELELAKLSKAALRDVVGARTRAIHDAELLAGKATARTETIATDSLEREIERLFDRAAS